MKEVVLGLLGLGNIGGGVWDLVREFGDETAKRTGVSCGSRRLLCWTSGSTAARKCRMRC